MKSQVEKVEKFLYGWVSGREGVIAPGRVVSLYGILALDWGGPWHTLNALENTVEQWAIELDVNLEEVDEAHPDAPMADNIVRKLMMIRGCGRAR